MPQPSSSLQQFFIMTPGTGPADALIQKSFPALDFSPSEADGLYQEVRELAGQLWFVNNAQYNQVLSLAPTAAGAWNQVSTSSPSGALVFTQPGAILYYSAAATFGAGLTPITLIPGVFTIPGAVSTVGANLPLSSSGGSTPVISLTGIVPVANGGTGTATPSLVNGTNTTVSGTFPAQAVNVTTGAGGVTAVAGGTNILSTGGLTPSISTVSAPTFPGLVTASAGVSTTTVVASGVVSASQFNGSGAGLSAGSIPDNSLITPPVTSVGASGALASSGGTTPNITLTAPLSVPNGGTGSTSQNFVDLTNTQTVAGLKTFSGGIIASASAGLQLTNGTSNLIFFGAAGVGLPTFTTRSVGTKEVFSPALSGTAVDYAAGIAPNTLWMSVPDSTRQFQWYAATTLIAQLSGAGAFAAVNLTATAQVLGNNVASQASGATAAYVPPVYGSGGSATAATEHTVRGTTNVSVGNGAGNATATVTFSGQAAFSSATSYQIQLCWCLTGTSLAATWPTTGLQFFTNTKTASGFVITINSPVASTSTGTYVVDWIATGT
jgi:hypothetical protein